MSNDGGPIKTVVMNLPVKVDVELTVGTTSEVKAMLEHLAFQYGQDTQEFINALFYTGVVHFIRDRVQLHIIRRDTHESAVRKASTDL